jgi:hypothetical protein
LRDLSRPKRRGIGEGRSGPFGLLHDRGKTRFLAARQPAGGEGFAAAALLGAARRIDLLPRKIFMHGDVVEIAKRTLQPASAASKIWARLSRRAACLPALNMPASSSRSAWLNSTR